MKLFQYIKFALRFIGRKISWLIKKVYLFIFSRPATQKINNYILQLALRARGYNNWGESETTGEAYFIDLLAKTNPKLIIDIGANKGNYSTELLAKTNADIIAFEPLPKAYEYLLNIKTKYPTRFEAVNAGVGAKEETLELLYGSDVSVLASFSKEVKQVDYVGQHVVNVMKVPVTTLDAYYHQNIKGKYECLDLLKIDTEGFEYEVLMGAQQTLSQLRPKFIQIEYNWHQLFRNQSLRLIAELMPGYSAYQMLPNGHGIVKRDLNRPESNIYNYSNFVFIRDDVKLIG